MVVLEEKTMEFLVQIQPKMPSVYPDSTITLCGCTGSCGQSCVGGCKSGCTGDCGRSCSGTAS